MTMRAYIVYYITEYGHGDCIVVAPNKREAIKVFDDHNKAHGLYDTYQATGCESIPAEQQAGAKLLAPIIYDRYGRY